MTISSLINQIARSIGFLSRCPVPKQYFEENDETLAETCAMFPVAGALIALPIALIASLLSVFDTFPMIIAASIITLQTIMTGALHEDGLSDTIDGFWGGNSTERKLEIMRDSQLGTYGVLALIFSILINFSALTALASFTNPMQLALIIITAATISRTTMVWHWSKLPPARTDGVAAQSGQPDHDTLNIALISGGIISTLCLLIATGFYLTIVTILIAALLTFTITNLTEQKIEGHTGDTIGAVQQITELSIYLTLALLI